jgi:hypothetical protein
MDLPDASGAELRKYGHVFIFFPVILACRLAGAQS